MKTSLKYILFIAVLFAAEQLNAQSKKVGILYAHEATLGVGVHTSGWNISFIKGNNSSSFKQKFWEIDIWTLKHPKEIRTSSRIAGGKSYVYDKVNNFASFQAGFGRNRWLVRSERQGSVGIVMSFSGGLSLGVYKPVYMNVVKVSNNIAFLELERYDPEVHYPGIIQGRGPFTSGISELKVLPGLYSKVGLQVRYRDEGVSFSSLEVGCAINAFVKAAPIMGFSENKQLFVSLYLCYRYGNRWNK